MKFCQEHEANILIDNKPYRFDGIRGYAAIIERQRRFKGLEFIHEFETLSRLLNEVRDRAAEAGTKYSTPKKVKQRLDMLSSMAKNPIHGDG